MQELDEFSCLTEFLDKCLKKSKINFRQMDHIIHSYIENPGLGTDILLDRFNLDSEFRQFFSEKKTRYKQESLDMANIRAYKITEINHKLKDLNQQLIVAQEELEKIKIQHTNSRLEFSQIKQKYESLNKHLLKFPDNPRLINQVCEAKHNYSRLEERMKLLDKQIDKYESDIQEITYKIKDTKNQLLDL